MTISDKEGFTVGHMRPNPDCPKCGGRGVIIDSEAVCVTTCMCGEFVPEYEVNPDGEIIEGIDFNDNYNQS